MILATKTHQPFNQDSATLLDIDLSILGAPDAGFDAYDRAVRQEYNWVPDDVYEPARKQVLQSFLDREHIYHTPVMFEQFEHQAKCNLKRRVDFVSAY